MPLISHPSRYIPYALGGGYVLGKTLVDYLATNSHMVSPPPPPPWHHQLHHVLLLPPPPCTLAPCPQLEIYNSEDASVGAWLAGTTANRKHDPRCPII